MTRKRRLTRTRQKRRRIHARTRQTLQQAYARWIEVRYDQALNAPEHPFVRSYRRAANKVAAKEFPR